MDLEQYLDTQKRWSRKTFGDGKRTIGICSHIRKELEEVAANPTDPMEWIDVCILAMDGYWRAGGKLDLFADMLQSEDMATEHIRD